MIIRHWTTPMHKEVWEITLDPKDLMVLKLDDFQEEWIEKARKEEPATSNILWALAIIAQHIEVRQEPVERKNLWCSYCDMRLTDLPERDVKEHLDTHKLEA